MAKDIVRRVTIRKLSADEIALAVRLLSTPEWRESVARRLKSRHLPWRSAVSPRGLSFLGTPLWPSQRRYVADRMRGFIGEAVRTAQGRGGGPQRTLINRARELRRYLREKK